MEWIDIKFGERQLLLSLASRPDDKSSNYKFIVIVHLVDWINYGFR